MKTKWFPIFGGILALVVALSSCGSGQWTSTPSESAQPEVRPVVQGVPPQSGVPKAGDSTSMESKSPVADQHSPSPAADSPIEQLEQGEQPDKEQNTMKMKVQVENNVFEATLEDNQTVDVFAEMIKNGPLILTMRDYAGFEKVASLGTSLPTDNSPTTTQAGDIVLYNGNQIVLFYGSNSWSYTRLGKIDDLSGWEDALGSGEVTVSFSLD